MMYLYTDQRIGTDGRAPPVVELAAKANCRCRAVTKANIGLVGKHKLLYAAKNWILDKCHDKGTKVRLRPG